MRSVVRAVRLMALLLSSSLFANYQWLGTTDSDFLNAGNWEDARVPSFDQTEKELTIIANGSASGLLVTNGLTNGSEGDPLTFYRLYLTYSSGLAGSVTQTGGNISLTDGNAAAFVIGYSSAAEGSVDGSVYTLSGGTLSCASTGGGLIIGNWSSGRLVQTGGHITLQGPIQMGLNANEGKVRAEYVMSGGTLTQEGTALSGIGVNAPSSWTLSGEAAAVLSSGLRVGLGDGVRISGDARLSCGGITALSQDARVVLDGGTLALTADQGSVSGLAVFGITPNGATLDVPDGVSVTVQPISAVEGSGGRLIKKGNGTLMLSSGNTYAGGTEVISGIIGLDSPEALASLTLSAGTGVIINPAKWDAASVSTLCDMMKAAGCVSFGFFTTAGEVAVLDETLSLNNLAVVIDGAGTLVLNGVNQWTGDTHLKSGVLAARRGAGLPAASKLVMEGGSWAPMAASVALAIDGSDALFELAEGAPLGLAAVGMDTSVTLNGGAEIQIGVNAHFGELRLNDGASDHTLTLVNDFLLNDGTIHQINIASENTNAVAHFSGRLSSGDVSNASHFEFIGGGKLKLDGEMKTNLNEIHFYNEQTDLLNIQGLESTGLFIFSSKGATVNVGPNASIVQKADIRIGDNADASGTLNINGGAVTANGWMTVGRYKNSEGTLNVNDGAVTANTFMVGQEYSTGTVNQNGGTVDVQTLQMGHYTKGGNIGQGLATYNLYDGTFSAIANNAMIGYYGRAVFNQFGGTSVFMKRTLLTYYKEGSSEFNLFDGVVDSRGDWRVGNNGKGVFNMSGGTFTTTGYLHVGPDNNANGAGDGEVFFTGGDATMKARTWIAGSAGTQGALTVDNGTLGGRVVFAADVAAGYKGTGALNVKSGQADQTGGTFYVGQESGSTGAVNITGGVYDYEGGGSVTVGSKGYGTLTISSGGMLITTNNYVNIGYWDPAITSTGVGVINLLSGGTLYTTRVHGGWSPEPAVINVDGGVIRAAADCADFLENISVNIGADGLTLDSNGYEVGASGATLTSGTAGTVRKTGEGSFALGEFPLAKSGLSIDEGTLRIAYPALRHRWSFNGGFRDAVSGVSATLENNVKLTANGQALAMEADTRLDLGRNMAAVDRDVTIEMWVTRLGAGTWEKLFVLGSSKNDYIFVGPQNNNNDSTVVAVKDSNGLLPDGTDCTTGNVSGLGTMTIGEKMHVSVTIRRTSDTSSEVVFRLKRAADGTTVGTVTQNLNWNMKTLVQNNFWLGKNPWSNPSTICEIDEIRVWDKALTDEELNAGITAGPDRLVAAPAVAANDPEVLLPSNPDPTTVNNHYLVHRWAFNGNLTDAMTGTEVARNVGTTFSEDGRSLRLLGGNKMASYVDLGSDLLPADDSPVTIEMWATENEYVEWAKLFSLGKSKTDLLSINTNAGSPDSPGYLTTRTGDWAGKDVDTSRFKDIRLGQKLHYSIVIVPNGDGSAEMTFRRKDAVTGVSIDAETKTVWWTPRQSAQVNFYLGVSYWSNLGPKIDYDEIRIWNAALSDAQLTANVLKGADAVPAVFDLLPLKVTVASGAALDISEGTTLTLHDFEPTGSVLGGGTIAADGVVSPGGDDAAAVPLDGSLLLTGTLRLDYGDVITATGDIVLDGTTFVFADVSDVEAGLAADGSWTVLSSENGSVTLRNVIRPAGLKFRFQCDGKSLKMVPPGFAFIIR